MSFDLKGCDGCGLVFNTARDALVREEVEDFTENFFENIGNHPLMFETELRRLCRFLGVGHLKGRRLVDVGCGNGLFLDYCRRQGILAAGVELSRALRETVKGRGILVFETMDELRQAQGGAIDIVYCSHTLEHFIDPLAALKEMHDALAPGGVLQVTVPCLNRLTFALERTLIRLGVPSGWGIFYPVHLTYFNRRSLRAILERAGFRDLVFRPGVLGENLLRKAFGRSDRMVRFGYRGLVEPMMKVASWVDLTPNLSVLARK